MSMRRLPLPAFLLTRLAAGGYLAGTVSELPERVPTRFGSGGTADAFAPRIARRSANLPNRDSWLAPARRCGLRLPRGRRR